MLSQEYRIHFLLHSAHLLEERLRERLGPIGLHPRQARVLDALGRMGQASQIGLANEFGLTAASMSTMTARLLKAGLIEKCADEGELRSNILTLTSHGEDLLKAVYREWRAVDREIREAIGSENARRLGSLALQLRNALGGKTPGSETAKAKASATTSARRGGSK